MRANGETSLTRGTLGTMELPTSIDDELHLDFVESVRAFTLERLNSRARQALEDAAGGHELPAGNEARLELARQLAAELPAVALRNAFSRQCQEMIWRRVISTYEPVRAELLAALDEAESRGPGRLLLDPPGFELPTYLADYHLEPGGYHTDPLSGYIYHYGTKIFWVGMNDHDEQKTAAISDFDLPEGLEVRRVVELGCSVGQSTTALKGRFPQAEVWGTDVAAPLLRYAHLRAARLGIEVNFAQQAAEHLNLFDDESVDLVYATILFHEMPVESGRKAVAEAQRVLRPGGVLVVRDMRPLEPGEGLWTVYDRWFDSTYNEEPHEAAYLRCGFDEVLASSFGHLERRPIGLGLVGWTAVKQS